MARKRFVPGSFIRLTLPDGSYGYGRMREEMLTASFYDFQTEEPKSDLNEIAGKPILFTVGLHKSVRTKWENLGKLPLEDDLKQPFWRFWQDIGDYKTCIIYDKAGNKRDAIPEECEGLERVASWEAHHVEERLLDTFMERPNRYVEQLRVRYKD